MKDTTQEPVLRMEGIVRRFPGVTALKGVGLDVRPNEILGLLGENGAGKSVLTKIMIGIHQPDEGRIVLNGRPVTLNGTADATAKGIGAVFQEGSLIANLSIAENLFLCHEQGFLHWGFLSRRAMSAEARRLMAQVRLDVDVGTLVSALSPAARQMVEIARVLWLSQLYGAANPIIILDEPTTVLNDAERATLFALLRDLKARASIIFISHRLQEVLEICDRISVLRDGENVSEAPTAGLDVAQVETLLVGQDFTDDRFRESAQRPHGGRVVLRAEGLAKAGAFEPVDLTLHEGEIVAMVGLVGSGKEELIRCLTGLVSHDAGRLVVDGVTPRNGSARAAVLAGIGHVPVERREEGLALNMSVADNINALVLERLKTLGLIDPRRENAHAAKWVAECLIKTPSLQAACSDLSGGNQQKIILSKWLASDVKVLILDHPTRGIDIGAKDEVYRLIRTFAAKGIAMLILCDTLEEDIGLANRLVVMRDRKVIADLPAPPEAKPSPRDLISLIV